MVAPDGYMNLTAICRAYGKDLNDFLQLESTQVFLRELSLETGIPVDKLIREEREQRPCQN